MDASTRSRIMAEYRRLRRYRRIIRRHAEYDTLSIEDRISHLKDMDWLEQVDPSMAMMPEAVRVSLLSERVQVLEEALAAAAAGASEQISKLIAESLYRNLVCSVPLKSLPFSSPTLTKYRGRVFDIAAEKFALNEENA